MKWLILIILLLILSGCSQQKQNTVCFKNQCINVEIADTQEEQLKGLMFRDQLSPNQGMIFILEKEDYIPIWMENMLIPLDIIWIDANNKVTKIQKANLCSGPCEIYTGFGKYVLEVNQGTAEKLNINLQDTVKLYL